MMLANSSFASPMPHYSAYTPPRSSPLSERSANVPTRLFDFSMASPSMEKKIPVSQRSHKPNPVLQTRDAATKRRREMFFKRVQTNRDDKKWEARGEQIQHLDFVSERKRWEAEKARQAPTENDFFDEEIVDETSLPEWSNPTPQFSEAMTEADWVATQEEYELQQMIASMEHEPDASSQHYGSDDDDYDSIFMECVNAVDASSQQQINYLSAGYEDVDMVDMDMTDG